MRACIIMDLCLKSPKTYFVDRIFEMKGMSKFQLVFTGIFGALFL